MVMSQHVAIAGATGYLGRYLCDAFQQAGWQVRALVRDVSRAQDLAAKELRAVQATDTNSLKGALDGVDLVISALGLTRQRDGLSYRDVDYQANANLLSEARAAGVGHFAYVHVLGAEHLRNVELVAAKQAFVDELRAAPIKHTVIEPGGYFSDMADFFAMAQSGRVWLFGDGQHVLNPIHGADLALACVDAVQAERELLQIGGPDILSQKEIATLAFDALGKPARITCLPDVFRRLALRLLPWLTPRHISGPAQFFLTALAQDMVGTPHGTRRLADHFRDLAKSS